MRILHLTQYFHPLRGYQENQLAKLQAEDGHEVFVVASDDLSLWGVYPTKIPDLDADFMQKKNITIIRLGVKRKIGSRIWLKKLKETLEHINPDLLTLHIIPTPSTFEALKWGSAKNKKIIVDSHMVWAGSRSPKLSKVFYTFFKFYFSFFLKIHKVKIDKWIAVSSETIDFMRENYGVKEEIHFTPLGFDSSNVFEDKIGAKSWIETNNLPSNKKILLYIGKINSEKDPIQLIEVFNTLRKENSDLILVFVGDYDLEYRNKIESEISKYQVDSSIYLLNSVENSNIKNVFSAVDVAIWPHGSSMAMIEAMACNCPVVAPKMPVNEERLENNRGLLFEENDLDSLKNVINEALLNSNKYVENAKNWVANFGWDKLYKDYYIN